MNSPGPEATPPPEPSLSMWCSGSGAANQVDPSLFPSLPMQSSLPQLSADYKNAILGILGAINSWLEAFDATQNRGAMSGLMRHLVKFYDASWFFTLLTLAIQLTQTCNAKLEACLNYGGRLTRMLLYTILTHHPVLTKVYHIIKLGVLSLHITTLLVAFMLYTQEVFLLATQMDPRFTIA
jgi:hypothetical protein